MDQRYNLYNLEASFKQWLLAGIEKTQNNANPEEYQGQSTRKGLTKISIKNYLSDLRHFFGWLIFELKVKNQKLKIEEISINEFINCIDASFIEEYKNYLTANSIPIKTINRRLSTLRKFFTFCINQGWIKDNPAKKVQNLNLKSQNGNLKIKMDSMINSFASDLQKEKLNQDAIKSYLEVVQEFLSL